MMYKYENAIEILTGKIPEMKRKYLKDKEYYEDIPYVFYETVFEKFVVKKIKEKNSESTKRNFTVIEDLLKNGDDELKALVDVAIVESIFFEDDSEDLINHSSGYFGELTKLSFERFNK